MLELLVLGPVRLQRAGQPVHLAVRKSQALLLYLALQGSTGRAALCALLWPELPGTMARRNLRRELARLREGGLHDALRTDGDRLAVADSLHVDLTQAEAALARQAPDEALARWPGPLADGLAMDDAPAFDEWLATARRRVAGLHQRALQASAAFHEARGDINTALARVQALLQGDSLQESHHRDAMRLLAASGQTAAAFRQFETCRALLAAELGLQPMAETLALAAALRGPAALPVSSASLIPGNSATLAAQANAVAWVIPVEAPAEPVRTAWPAVLPFVGRDAEVARLQTAWNQRAPMAIVGEGGVGKTRLTVGFAAAQGPYALVRCRPDDREVAFGAFVRALRVLAGQPPDLRGLAPWVQAELARLLPELGIAPAPLQGETERLRFDEACILAWSRLAADSFDAIVLDDWHHADAASHALLGRVAARRRDQGGAGAIEMLVCRPEHSGSAEALAALSQAADAVVVTLAPLPPQAVYQLVQSLSGAADPVRFAERLSRATGGNAYFIAETLRDLAESAVLVMDAHGRWSTAFDQVTQDYRELPLAPSVRDAVLARVRRLGPAAARVLEAAALAGEPFGAAMLASACALSEMDTLAALDQAAVAQLLRAHDEGGYGWGHDLVQQALESALAPARRRLMHHRLALAAEALGRSAAAALHFEACGEAPRAAPHRLAAGDAAQALQALAEAARHWRLGLADGNAPAPQAALLARLCEAEFAMGRTAEAEACLQRVQALLATPEGQALSLAAQADVLPRVAAHLTRSDRSLGALALLDRVRPAMSAASGTAPHLRWLVAQLAPLKQLGRIDETRAVCAQVLTFAPPDGRERIEVVGALANIEHATGHSQAAVARANEFIALSTRLGDGLTRVRGLLARGGFRCELGEHREAEADLREAAALAAGFGSVYLQRIALYNLASTFSAQTRPDDTLAAVREGWALGGRAPGDQATAMFRSMFIEAHYVRGEWGLAFEHATAAVTEVLAASQPLTMVNVAMTAFEPLAMLGQWRIALPLMLALESGQLAQMPQSGHEVWLACAQAALLQGDAAAAAEWLQRLGPQDSIEHDRVRHRLALLWAEQVLATGKPGAALARLPADDAPGMNDELRLRALALRYRAAGDAGPDPATVQRVHAALADPRAHAGAALQLAQALGGAGLAARVQTLAQGLERWPEVQASFLALWSAPA